MSADFHRRYVWLAVAYLAVAAVVVAITAAFFGLLGLALSVLGALSCFVLAVVFLRDTFLGLAREHYEEEVGTWRRVAAIALLGLVFFPLLVVVNSWVFAIVFTNGTALVCGSFGGAVFASAAGALAARYMVSSRALRPEVRLLPARASLLWRRFCRRAGRRSRGRPCSSAP